VYKVGDIFNNAWEVGPDNYPIDVEIMHVWIDEDEEVYYIIKCRAVGLDNNGRRAGAWLWEDDVDLVSHGHLEKYYEKRRFNA
jgi:hypothetical protein